MADADRTDRNDTHQKALSINLEKSIYGTLAEIGAGQEVARWFLQVGGASGTVASTISAYDMTVSDDIYGKVGRYVSRERLVGMLDKEFKLLVDRLDATRGEQTRFFVFADTVSAMNFAGTNDCHGWVGLRFQATPRGPTNDIVLHVNLRDPSNLLQQQAAGILGVNLIWAAYHQRADVRSFLAALFDDLAGRVEVDYLLLAGPEFAAVDERAALLELVLDGHTEAVLFPLDGPPRPPSEALYKRAVVFEAGVFEDVDELHGHMLASARSEIAAELGKLDREPLTLFALTPRRPAENESPDAAELLSRIDRLMALGSGVLVLRDTEAYRLVEYAMRHTKAPIRLVSGVATIAKIMQERQYDKLEGQLLEALAKLFAFNVRLYVYPMSAADFRSATAGSPAETWVDANQDGNIDAAELAPPPPVSHLYQYLMETGFLRSISP